MPYYLYLKRQSVYVTLTSITYTGEVQPGMAITFASHELAAFEREYSELKGMGSTYTVTNVYSCDGMGGIFLSDIFLESCFKTILKLIETDPDLAILLIKKGYATV